MAAELLMRGAMFSGVMTPAKSTGKTRIENFNQKWEGPGGKQLNPTPRGHRETITSEVARSLPFLNRITHILENRRTSGNI